MSKSRTMVGVLALCGLASLYLTPVPAQAQIQAARALNVYDASGLKVTKILGVVDVSTNEPIVAFKAGGIPFLLRVGNSTPFFQGSNLQLYFSSFGCSGQAYLRPLKVMAASFAFPPNASVYISDPKVSPGTVLVNSYRSQPSGDCTDNPGFSDLLVPAISVGDLLPRFTPPFTVK